jgi:serine/threonine protein kinase
MGNEQSSSSRGTSSPTNPRSISPSKSPRYSNPGKLLGAPLTPETSISKPMPITTRARTSSETELKYQEGVFAGAQGCVIIPSLIVEGMTQKRNTQYITKIFEDESLKQEEIRLDELVKSIDPSSSFTNVNYNENPIDISKLTEKDIKNCGAIIKSRENLLTKTYLNYEYLGLSLHTIFAYNKNITLGDAQDIIAGLLNLSQKISLMNKGEIIGKSFFHNDVHQGNVMFNPVNRRIYLIDFGLATSDFAKRKGSVMDDILGIFRVTYGVVEYILKKIPSLSEKQGKAISDFISFAQDNYLLLKGKKPPSGFQPREITAELLLSEIQKLQLGFSSSGGKRRRTKKRKTLRRRKLHR